MVRVVFKDSKVSKNIATALKKYVRSTGGEAKQTECIQLCARMYGYRNQNELLAALSEEASTPDAYTTSEELHLRVLQFLEEIELVGFSREEAWDLICGAQAGPWLGIDRFMQKPPAKPE